MHRDCVRIRIRYTGRVQGVGFRATTRAIASRHPVTGWVRNEPDGSVLAEAQGEAARLESFLADVAGEMEHNIVTAEREPAAPVPGERAFVIAY